MGTKAKPTIKEQITFIYVAELETSRKFYEEILGFELVVDQGSCRIVRSAEGGYLGYCEKGGGEVQHSDLIITLVSDDVDQWYTFLVEQKVDILEPPRVNPDYQIYHFFFHDPDGYKIEIQRFLDPSWNTVD
jgi:catechol 2,3-dioxygenase-like lactoylglutathione lyase family enzyme